MSGQVALLPSVGGGGWSFALRPGYGSGIAEWGSTGRIWGQGVRKDAVGSSAGLRVESRLGYGLVLREGRGLVTPWGGLTLDEVGRRYQLGLDWGLGSPLRLNLSAERREAAGLSTPYGARERRHVLPNGGKRPVLAPTTPCSWKAKRVFDGVVFVPCLRWIDRDCVSFRLRGVGVFWHGGELITVPEYYGICRL